MTDAVVPAWSEVFVGDGPGPAPPFDLVGPITPAWAYGAADGRGVTVGVVDSGIEAGHPQVGPVERAIAVELLDDVPFDEDSDEANDVLFVEGPHDDLYGHGTACAAIVRSLAPAVELVSVRVLGGDLRGSAYAFSHGLEWCIENGVNVINLSMSTANDHYAESFYELLDLAAAANVMVVSAMNNERKRCIPSEFSGVFSVACHTGQDRERFTYNPSPPAEWGAPGIDVEVAWSGGSTIVATGNSFAAPVIAGHLARIVGAHPGITTWQAKTVLAALADNASSPARDG